MRFISILASASVKLATRLPGANRLPALDFDARGASAALDLDARGDDFFQSINDDYSEAVVRSVKHAYTMDDTGYATLHGVNEKDEHTPSIRGGEVHRTAGRHTSFASFLVGETQCRDPWWCFGNGDCCGDCPVPLTVWGMIDGAAE